MLIRAAACLILVLASMAAAIPTAPHNSVSPNGAVHFSSINPDPFQLNGTQFAFNSTLGHFDLYNKGNATVSTSPSNDTLTWFSKFNSTVNGSPIPNTAFNYTVPKNPVGSADRMVNYTLNIPSGLNTPSNGNPQSSGNTYVKFDWNGNITSNTSARYLVYNGTKLVRRVVAIGNFTGSPANVTSVVTGPPVSCGVIDECFDATPFIGYNLTLTFLFNSTSSGQGLIVHVSNVEVASVKIIQSEASSHWMFVNPSNASDIIHYARMPLNYTAAISYRKPHTTNLLLNHTWAQMVVNLFWPSSYTINNVTIGTTRIYPTTSPSIPLSQGSCVPIVPTLECTSVTFVSLNMTHPLDNALNQIASVTARTTNAITYVKTSLGTADTNFWTPGENVTLRVANSPGVNRQGPQATWFTSPQGLPEQNSTLTLQAAKGIANYSISLPTSPVGNWTVTAVFSNGYDYGIRLHQFRIDELQISSGSFSLSGSAGSSTPMTVKGSLSYLSNSTAAAGVNATIFAISNGPGAGIAHTIGNPSSGLYISNITEVNGAGSIGQPIVMYFNIVNPTSNFFSANLTIDHEWYPGQVHGVNATIINLKLGDQPFTKPPLTFVLQAAITSTGIQLTIQSLQTNNKIVVDMTQGSGTSAVPSLRQHFGLFRLTLRSNTTSTIAPTSSVESPPYAYVLYAPLIPSQLLAYSSTISTLSDGSFTASIPANQLLGAKSVSFMVLGRDLNGIVLGDRTRNPIVSSDSTTITPTVDGPSTAAVSQSVTMTLHLKSNSTMLPMTLSVNLDVVTGGSTVVPTQTRSVSLSPGASQDAVFTFNAPSSAGLYVITFSSPQYGIPGSPLLTKSIQVSLVSSNLQILIPAGIGLVAAIVILGIYISKRTVGEEPSITEKTKPATKAKPQNNESLTKSLTRPQT